MTADTCVNTAPEPKQSFRLDRPLRDALTRFEFTYFEFHLARAKGSMTQVAFTTGLERTHLYRKLKHLQVNLEAFRPRRYRSSPTLRLTDSGRLRTTKGVT